MHGGRHHGRHLWLAAAGHDPARLRGTRRHRDEGTRAGQRRGGRGRLDRRGELPGRRLVGRCGRGEHVRRPAGAGHPRRAADIEGWAQGLEGIRQGGTRLIVLPPDLGYSAQGGNPLAGESLVIVAEAVRVA
ncbi:FKBP-type peptidyl-prolyl cis-trans isomerase [Prauserella oleivorans]